MLCVACTKQHEALVLSRHPTHMMPHLNTRQMSPPSCNNDSCIFKAVLNQNNGHSLCSSLLCTYTCSSVTSRLHISLDWSHLERNIHHKEKKKRSVIKAQTIRSKMRSFGTVSGHDRDLRSLVPLILKLPFAQFWGVKAVCEYIRDQPRPK